VATPVDLYLIVRGCDNFYYHHKFLKLFSLNSFPWGEEIHFLKRNLFATHFLKFGLKNLKNEERLGLMDDLELFGSKRLGQSFSRFWQLIGRAIGGNDSNVTPGPIPSAPYYP